MPFKSSDNLDQSLKKKLKRLDGLEVSFGTDTAAGDAGGFIHEASQSLVHGTDGSEDENAGNTGACQAQRINGSERVQNGSERVLSTDDNKKVDTQVGPSSEEKGNGRTARVSEDAPAPAKVAEFSIGLPNEIMEPSAASVVSSAGAGLAFEGFILDERQLKRERRKQANRESARKSRLKKQAEVDELMRRYESLNVENTALKFELDQLKEDSEKLRIENAALMDKLKNTQVEQQEEIISAKIEADLAQPKNSENVPNNHSVTGNVQ
ncbi:hypothetical protein ACB092_01G162600 [Castanea dentata]